MANIFSFKGFIPVVHPTAFVHPNATVTGNVMIGKDVYIGPGAAIRGDWGRIEIGDGCNVQENCTIHMFPGKTVVLEPGAHVGHGAVVHGAHLGRNCMIGMNAVLMDDAMIGADSIVGALTFVPAGMSIPEKSVAVGNPARIIREASEEMIAWKTKGTSLYQQLPHACRESLIPCEPLEVEEPNRPNQENLYKIWNDIKNTP